MGTSTAEALMAHMGGGGAGAAPVARAGCGPKITVVGSRTLALATVFALVTQRVSDDIVLLDPELSSSGRQELADVEAASLHMRGAPASITASTEWASCEGSRVLVLAPGMGAGDELARSARLVRAAALAAAERCPRAVVLVAARPSDALAWLTWRAAAPVLPAARVLGVGCAPHSAGLRAAVARRLAVAPAAVQAAVVGRGSPAWNTLTACGVRLRDINPRLGACDDPEDWQGCLQGVARVPGVRATAAAAAHIADVILRDSRECLSVATRVPACGPHGPRQDVFMSLPCVLGHAGVLYVVRQALSQEEKEQLQIAADELDKLQAQLEST